MKQYIPILEGTGLFAGLSRDELHTMLPCLNARVREFPKGAYVVRRGTVLQDIALPVRGALHIQREDYWGNRDIVRRIHTGELFGEAYIAPGSGALIHDVVAVEDSTVMFFDVRKILTVCSSSCRFHTQVVQNLFFTICEKNRLLLQKMSHLTRRTTREKLISYLSEEAKRQNSARFSIPFNRQQLADFLSVDRSAMSNELCKMRNEGLLEFDKNRFHLL